MVTNFVRFREGSSPRMRGTQQLESAARPQEGLIPTYAGNTCFQGVASRYDGAHPHVCGEHGIHRCARNPHKGSSPRMRGTLQFVQVYVDGAGLIPTYAGNTTLQSVNAFSAWAHPHVCGEHKRQSTPAGLVRGSSPRMRGTQRRRTYEQPPTGLIPTYAGNTCGFFAARPTAGAHPHVCGEHLSAV